MDKREIEKVIKETVAKEVASALGFRKWRKFDSATDVFSPITGNSSQIGFFGTPKIAQPTTAGGSATFADSGATVVHTASTFDGYTISQVVKALRNLGLLK